MTTINRPSTTGLLIQITSFVATAVTIFIAQALFSVTSTLLTLVMGTATLAATISWRRRQPRWWTFIQFIFPFAVLMAAALQIEPMWYLVAFISSLAVFGMIHKTRVPYYPSRKAIWEELDTRFKNNDDVTFIDIGCGLGGCATYLQQQNKTWTVAGIELAVLPWILCKIRSIGRKKHPDWLYGDYKKLDFHKYNLIFAYLSPAAMLDLEKKVAAELKPDSVLVSLSFKLPNREPSEVITTAAGVLYLYKY